MSLSRQSNLFLAALILLVAAVLRLAQVGESPPGLHYDEAADTIIAREIVEGRSAPIFVSAYTGKEVLFFYWAAAWMKLIGATPFAMRVAAAMLGVVTVAATHWAMREMFRSPPLSSPPLRGGGRGGAGVALLAALFLATSFWHVSMSRLGFRSIAEPCVQAFAVAAVWRGLRLNDRRWLLLGSAFVGLNLYTYLAARLFPVAIAALFAYLIVADAGHRRERLIQFGLVTLSAAVVFAPLGIYFLQNPDAFLTRITQVAPREGQDVWSNFIRALGMFFVEGDPYVRFNLPGRPLFPSVLGVLFLVGLLVSLVGVVRGRTRLRRAAYFFTLASTLIMLLPTALAVNEITPSNLRAIGLMPTVFVFPALGTWWVVKRMRDEGGRMKRLVPRRLSFILHPSALILLLLVGLAADTGRVYFDDYARSPQLYYESDGDLVEIAEFLNRREPFSTTVYVHALHYRHPTLAALTRQFHEVRFITGADVLVLPPWPSTHVYAHLALPTDRAWRERFLPPTAQVNASFGPDGQISFEVVDIDAPVPIQPERALDVNFGNSVQLLGYDLESTPRSGEAVDVTLYWHVRNPPDRGDYAVFVELRDVWGFEWGRADSFDYPAEQWTPGETIIQRLRVPIAPGAPRGDYQLDAGWYSAGANQRLPVSKPDGSFGGTTAALYPISIARAASTPSMDALGAGTLLDASPLDGLTLLGSSLETPGVPQGGTLFFTLFWRADAPLPDVPVAIRARSATGESATGESATGVASYMGRPVHGTYPFDEWTPGEVVADRYGLRVMDDAPPGDYALEVQAGSGAWIPFGSVRIEETQRRFDVPPIAYPLQATFGDQIELLGYDLDRTADAITLTLIWRALKTPDADYTVFTHLLDPSGVQVGGQDNQPVNGTYRTSLWIAGEVIVDPYVISIPAGAPPGEHAIEVGLYLFESGARLPLSTGGDALRLATIEIAP